MREIFSKFGAIHRMRLQNQCDDVVTSGMDHTQSRQYSNLAFIAYYSASDAHEAMMEMNGQWVSQRCLQVCIAKKRYSDNVPRN